MKLMFVGDVNLGEYYTNFGNGPGTYAESNDNFHDVASIFSTADLVACNLEASICSVGLNSNEPESVVLRAKPKSVNLLTSNNIKLVQVANNHAIQHGVEAFEENLDLLERNGVSYVGLKNAAPVVLTIDGQTIGFLAASDVPDNTDKIQTLYQYLNEEFIERVCLAAKSVDHLVVMLHWGLEASTAPLPYQREIARRLKSAGVRLIIGSHPHLFYEIEKDDSFVCAYSLGNFVFDLCWDSKLLKTGILEVNIDSSSKVSAKVWPVTIKSDGARPVPAGDPIEINRSLILYDLGETMRFQQIKKVIYHLTNIFRGNTSLKWLFFKRKILGIKPH